MYCVNCGKEINKDHKYCPYCGHINESYSNNTQVNNTGSKDYNYYRNISKNKVNEELQINNNNVYNETRNINKEYSQRSNYHPINNESSIKPHLDGFDKKYRKKHKGFIRTNRIIMWSILLILLLVPFILAEINKTKEINIISHDAYTDYDDYFNDSDVELIVKFDEECGSASIKVEFFDAENKSLGIKNDFVFYVDKDKGASFIFYGINGNVDSYQIIDCEASIDTYVTDLIEIIDISLIPIILLLIIPTYFLNYKEYNVDGIYIQAYAGYYHHELVVNGELVDIHDTWVTFSPINLNTEYNNKNINMMVTLTNRLRLKVDNRLIKK